MKVETPTTVPLAAPVAIPMDFGFGFLPTCADFAAVGGIGRIESRTVPRPLTTLLRQHCALTI